MLVAFPTPFGTYKSPTIYPYKGAVLPQPFVECLFYGKRLA